MGEKAGKVEEEDQEGMVHLEEEEELEWISTKTVQEWGLYQEEGKEDQELMDLGEVMDLMELMDKKEE